MSDPLKCLHIPPREMSGENHFTQQIKISWDVREVVNNGYSGPTGIWIKPVGFKIIIKNG